MTDRSEWEGRVGRKWADEWRRTDRSFAGVTERLLALARVRPIGRALDVGCGAGEIALALAREHHGAEVVGLDVSEDLVAAARARAAHLANVTFELADAAEWRREGYAPDLFASRHGVMFFPDPVAAFAHLHETAAPDARLVFSCFRAMAENPWAGDLAALVPAPAAAPLDPHAPGPFAFADRDRVHGILAAAGWRDIAFEARDFAYVAGTGEDPIGEAVSYFLAIGPAARAAADLSNGERAAFVDRLRHYLETKREGSLVALPGAAWIVTARG